jgi:exonuclease SbcD
MRYTHNKSLKILFLADTHLGFDLPIRPRIQRRRRGDDFFKNYYLALQPAYDKKVDLVIHGGDMFFRSRVHPKIVNNTFKPLLKIADKGIPIYIVPGNHERSNIPQSLLETHRLIHIFDKPKTFYFTKNELTLALAGFPYHKNGIRENFKNVVEQTGHQKEKADIRLLCMHHIVEGAQVGIQNYTFRSGEDVIQGREIPQDFLAVLSGHIHRWQVLTTDLAGRSFGAPVLYPGAIERTSFVERAEQKGYFIIETGFFQNTDFPEIKWIFHELPTRPMYVLNITDNEIQSPNFLSFLKNKIVKLDLNSIVQVKFKDSFSNESNHQINAELLRSIAPATMNIEITATANTQKPDFT